MPKTFFKSGQLQCYIILFGKCRAVGKDVVKETFTVCSLSCPEFTLCYSFKQMFMFSFLLSLPATKGSFNKYKE